MIDCQVSDIEMIKLERRHQFELINQGNWSIAQRFTNHITFGRESSSSLLVIEPLTKAICGDKLLFSGRESEI
jgi:hypothetical protein